MSASSKTRAAALARRKAMSTSGRGAQSSSDRTRDGSRRDTTQSAKPADRKSGDCGCGCGGNCAGKNQRDGAVATSSLSQNAPGASSSRGNGRVRRNNKVKQPNSRLLVQARRAAMSTRGKAAADTPTSAASLARQANPRLSSRELAQKVREQRSSNGASGERKTPSAGKIRAERKASRGASDQPWKVGASETARGQTVTGTEVSRSTRTTGNEDATCRTITGTEYMGAEIFREFCQTEPAPTGLTKVSVTDTSRGNPVTGNEVGRSPKVTGDEPGTCKSVTGTEYLASGHFEAFCETKPAPAPAKVGMAQTSGNQPLSGTQVGRSAKVTGDEHGAGVMPTGTQYTNAQSIQNGAVESAPAAAVPEKVGVSITLSGGAVTGTRVGRSGKVTGDEPGSCRMVTGDEYVDQKQYDDFCGTQPKPRPEPPKVGMTMTNKRQTVSGTQTGRSAKVTGDEPGTCKAVTGTPYAGLEQAEAYCGPDSKREIKARTPQMAGTPGPAMTGIQPGVGGVMTGDRRGACENVSGTPYVGKDQFAEACDGAGAAPGDSDFPQSMDLGAPAEAAPAADAPGQGFSVTSPARQAFAAEEAGGNVTGIRYETGNQITGPFDMAAGKITGTEQFRSDGSRSMQSSIKVDPADEEPEAAAQRSRVTGEGQSAGLKITGDDWDRGERVTGTEGRSAKRRNPTRPGAMGAMPPVDAKRNEEAQQQVSRVTGASGNTERGALITYSGGARG